MKSSSGFSGIGTSPLLGYLARWPPGGLARGESRTFIIGAATASRNLKAISARLSATQHGEHAVRRGIGRDDHVPLARTQRGDRLLVMRFEQIETASALADDGEILPSSPSGRAISAPDSTMTPGMRPRHMCASILVRLAERKRSPSLCGAEAAMHISPCGSQGRLRCVRGATRHRQSRSGSAGRVPRPVPVRIPRRT